MKKFNFNSQTNTLLLIRYSAIFHILDHQLKVSVIKIKVLNDIVKIIKKYKLKVKISLFIYFNALTSKLSMKKVYGQNIRLVFMASKQIDSFFTKPSEAFKIPIKCCLSTK